MIRRSPRLITTLGCAGHCYVTFTRGDYSGSGTDIKGITAPARGVSKPLVCCDEVGDSIAALSSSLRSICTYEADADTGCTEALEVEDDGSTDVLEVMTGSGYIKVWGLSIISICGAADISVTGSSSAISRGGMDSGKFLSLYTNCSSTKLVNVFDCALSGESITTVVSATADVDAIR